MTKLARIPVSTKYLQEQISLLNSYISSLEAGESKAETIDMLDGLSNFLSELRLAVDSDGEVIVRKGVDE